jgi:Flp pilus assembly protein TadG
MKPFKVRQQSGQVIMIVAFSLVALIGAVGLAVDSGLGYLVKAKLNAAVDSASIAGARAVSIGADQSAQAASAKQAARDFFNANIPNNYLGSTVVFNDPVVTFNQGKVTIDTSATASMPVSLTRVMGFNLLNVAASAETIRKDLDMAFVVDTSGSMSSVASTVRSSAVTFINKFNPTTDRMVLIHFSYGSVIDDPIFPVSRGFNRTSMTSHINAYGFSGLTNSPEGMWNARSQLNSIAQTNRSSLRVIVFFSDGAPNSFASYFTFKTPANCPTAVGTLTTGDGTNSTGPLDGLWLMNKQGQQASGNCYRTDLTSSLTTTGMPTFYNAHNITDNEFAVVTNSPRVVTNNPNWTNVNRASRNLAESIAEKARAEGIYVFTLGLGSQLQIATGPDSEKGEIILKCMANAIDALARCRNTNQPTGIYCFAASVDQLAPCFSRLASEILRISK